MRRPSDVRDAQRLAVLTVQSGARDGDQDGEADGGAYLWPVLTMPEAMPWSAPGVPVGGGEHGGEDDALEDVGDEQPGQQRPVRTVGGHREAVRATPTAPRLSAAISVERTPKRVASRADRGAGGEPGRPAEERQAGPQRAEAQHVLQVEGEEVGQRPEAAMKRKVTVTPRQVAVAEQPQRHQRARRAPRSQEEASSAHRDRSRAQHDARRSSPTPGPGRA